MVQYIKDFAELEEKKNAVIANEVAATKGKEENLGKEIVKFSGTDSSALIEGLIVNKYTEFKTEPEKKDAAVQKALIDLGYDLGNYGQKGDGVD
ncbi:MAG: hypothetical protein LBU27_02245 [Candidatus Peribacteria bacterium]|nr:hypothetical protein [Candidatus Peribacteria bacterium]